MSVEEERFAEVVAAIGDGTPIAWDTLEGVPEGDEERSVLMTLRSVEAVARYSRAVQRLDPGGGPVVAEAWGPLLKLERLGSGSSGEVWRAFEPRLKRDVALKLLSAASTAEPHARARLLEEGAHLARIHDAGVVSVYGIEEHAGRIGLWMELLEGDTLARIVERGGTLSAPEAVTVGVAACRALAAIHAAGIIHRDIKPENILRTPGGRLVVTDFGLGHSAESALAGLDAASGTPMYLAPEVLDGAPPNAATDLYALGVVLFHLVTGRYPHRATSLAELEESHRRRGGARLRDLRPDLPASFIRVIERAIDPDPGRRFPSAGALETELLASLFRPGDGATPGPPPAGRQPVRRGRGLAVAIVLAAAVVVVALGIRGALRGMPFGAPYDVEAFLCRGTGDALEPLADGDRVHPGDRVTLKFMATRPLHVYVLSQDDRGESYLLFPQPAYDQANPLPAGRIHRLPGAVGGRNASWTVTSAGGREHFLVVASPKSLPDLERVIAALPPPIRGRPVEPAAIPLSRENVGQLRGIGGYEVDSPAGLDPAVRPLFELVRNLAGKESRVHGVWMRQMSLTNPG